MEESLWQQTRLLLLAVTGEADHFTEQIPAEIQSIAADGSGRRFWRLALPTRSVIIVAPASVRPGAAELAESRSSWMIGSHLASKGVPVAQPLAWDSHNGLLLFADCGDEKLHDRIIALRARGVCTGEMLVTLYQPVLEALVAAQFAGGQDFYPDWCWDSQRYDRQLMLERESSYFLRAFWQRLLGQSTPPGLEEEFGRLADRCSQAASDYFLYRDYQSRNIMLQADGDIRLIDYQGGRLGPLGYDLASLLIDPYAGLPAAVQDQLFATYCRLAQERKGFVTEQFASDYQHLALQRNLQILGAYAFLSTDRGKPFFRQFLQPALNSLIARLAGAEKIDYPILLDTAGKALTLLKSQDSDAKA